MRHCSKCGGEIPGERLEALPDTKTCVACSGVARQRGHMVWSHKTAPVLSFIPLDAGEDVKRQIERTFRRQR